MAISRVNILHNASISHLIFRCHNREFLLENDAVKDFIITLWIKYKKVYKIAIFEFNILDNHAHFLAKFPTQKALSDFMRTVNSQIARFVNTLLHRDSQVLRERFRSPVVREWKYFRQVVSNIWRNTHDALGEDCDLKNYKYSSLHARYFKTELAGKLLDDYDKAGYSLGTSFHVFAESICNELSDNTFRPQVFENLHTVDDEAKIKENDRYFCKLSSMRRKPL